MVIVITIQNLILLIILFASLSAGMFVMLRDPHSVINQAFLIFLIGIALIALGFIYLSWHTHFNIFDKTIHYGGLILLAGLFIFSNVFPDKDAFPKQRLPLLIPFGCIALFVIPFNLLIQHIHYGSDGVLQQTSGPLLIPYIVFWGAYFVLSIVFLLRTYKTITGKKRTQMQYLFTGIVIFFACLFIFDLVLPLLGDTQFLIIGPFSSLVLIFLTGYAMLKHELLDIRVVIQRGLMYILLFICTMGIYIIGLELLCFLLREMTDIGAIISAAVTMTVGIFLTRPFEDYFKQKTNPLFFKNPYDYATALQELSQALHTNVAVTDIVTTTSTILTRIFQPTFVRFHLSHVNADLYRVDRHAELSIPIIFEKQQTGLLELGTKRSGEDYTAKDKQLLETFVCQAAVALEKGKLYEKVEQYSMDLEKLVAERTREIKKLQEDQKQVMIDISHNLQTPLAVIRGELELLNEFEDQAKITIVKKSIDRVSGFIRQLLHLARLEHSIYKIALSPLDIGQLLEEQVEYFDVMAEEKQVTIILSSLPSLTIMAHSRLLGELLTNLVSNAILYRSPDRKGVIAITLSQTATEAVITIEDNGMGIAADDIDGLFTRFYRGKHKVATEDTMAGQAGTGLGLAICKNIVERHNGTIRVESTIREKTVFTITLPLAKS